MVNYLERALRSTKSAMQSISSYTEKNACPDSGQQVMMQVYTLLLCALQYLRTYEKMGLAKMAEAPTENVSLNPTENVSSE